MATQASSPAPSPAGTSARGRNAERTRAGILSAATREFGTHGFAGARMERMASSARCNIRLLYHYFGDKKALYIAVLEAAYSDLRAKQAALDLDFRDPLGCVETLLRFSFGYFAANPYFEGLLRTENMMRGKFVAQSTVVPGEAARLKATLRRILDEGEASGQIRPGVDPVQLYVTITALARFHLANSYSLGTLLETDLRSEVWRADRLEHAVEMLRGWLTTSADNRAEPSLA